MRDRISNSKFQILNSKQIPNPNFQNSKQVSFSNCDFGQRFPFVIWCLVLGIFIAGCVPKKETNKPAITVWHWMTDRQSAFEELAKRYEEEKGVKVNFEIFFPPTVYSQKVQAAAPAQNLPEIFGILGEKKVLASFIKGGYILDLTSYMEGEWKERFLPQALANAQFEEKNIYEIKEGIYGVPLDLMNIQFLYNKDLFKKIGLDSPPQEFKEFISIAKRIKNELNAEGFICGWAETWLIYCLLTNYAFNIMGEEKFFSTLKGKVPYTDPDWIRVFSIFEEMKDILAPEILTMSNKEAEQMFARSDAIFSFNGSWCINVYKRMNPELNYGVFLPPKISDNFSMKIWGGAGSSFMVNPNSSHKEEAIEFLKWLTTKDAQIFLAKETNNLPSINLEREFIPEKLNEFLKNTEFTTHPDIWPINEDSRVIEEINRQIQKIIIGKSTPQTAAEEIQRIKERILRE